MDKMFGIQMTHSQYQMMQSLMGNMATSFSQLPINSTSPTPLLTAIQALSTASTSASPASTPPIIDRSSPVTENRDEEYEMMEQFWKIWLDSAPPPFRPRIQKAINIIDDEMWTYTTLQKMSAVGSDKYKLGMSKGLPEGFMTELRPRIYNFKEVWRTAKALRVFNT